MVEPRVIRYILYERLDWYMARFAKESGVYSGGNKKPVRKCRHGRAWLGLYFRMTAQQQHGGGCGAGRDSRAANTYHLPLHGERKELASHPAIEDSTRSPGNCLLACSF